VCARARVWWLLHPVGKRIGEPSDKEVQRDGTGRDGTELSQKQKKTKQEAASSVVIAIIGRLCSGSAPRL
jgi:hypothetical protein